MKKYLFISLLFLSEFSFAQSPLVKQWDKGFGGTSDEYFSMFRQTTDGGYILGGTSFSGYSGDKTQPTQDTCVVCGTSYTTQGDYWIVKINAAGNKQWDKRFGGTNKDNLVSLEQTKDGGYILGGNSLSGIGGDKTDTSRGARDYWVVKIDSLGNKQWDKTYGGSSDEYLGSVLQTTDGGYIIGGQSRSPVSGDKTQANWDTTNGRYDYWIVKIDAAGKKQWDKRYGGEEWDDYGNLVQTPDGGYLIGGDLGPFLTIPGDVTQPSWGGYDWWIIKIDAQGNKQWDQRYGGSSDDRLKCLIQTSDKGFLLGGQTISPISGDKASKGHGGFDYWLIKTDSLGNKVWDKDFGGSGVEDGVYSICKTFDGGYLLGGDSYSSKSGSKSENNFNNNSEEGWIIEIDSGGNKKWDKTIFTNDPEDDENNYAIQSADGGYLIANFTTSGIGGYKTQTSQGKYDYWIVKFADTTGCVPANAGIISASRDTICAGTPAKLNAVGISGTIMWQSSVTAGNFINIPNANNASYMEIPSQTTYYRIVAGGGKCADTSNVAKIVVNPAPIAGFTSSHAGLQVTFTDTSIGDNRYNWDFGDSTTSNEKNPVHTYTHPGSFYVCLTVYNGSNCSFTFCNYSDVATGITTISPLNNTWKIYPNPFGDDLYIEKGDNVVKGIEGIELYDLLGRLRFDRGFSGVQHYPLQVDLSELTNGMYYLKIKTANTNYIQSIIKQ